ncbi:MAG: formate dehydrogenase, partial [Salinibacterium sp.]|nr:formate dehydrogenase [Salinibacterium sp.]
EEYYRWIFENSVPGLPEAAKAQGLTPLAYMQKYGSFEVAKDVYEPHAKTVDVSGARLDEESGLWKRDDEVLGVDIEGEALVGFHTPSRRLEFFSQTMTDWDLAQHELPGYIRSHVHHANLDRSRGEFALVPTLRLPTLIHSRSANSKWLCEIANNNPVWIHVHDAARLGIEMGDLIRVSTRIGHFVNRAWVTEGMRPGVVACSHHLGRWRLEGMPGTDRWGAAPARLEETSGHWKLRRTGDIAAFESSDPDSKRVWWRQGGVHQNLTFAVQPDPVSGMHCWHQVVQVTKAQPNDHYGDVDVDTKKAHEVYQEWLAMAESGPRADGLRRPLWFARAVRPANEAYRR